MDIPKKFQRRFTHRVVDIVHNLGDNALASDLFCKLYEEQGSFASNFLQLEGIRERHLAFFSRKEKNLAFSLREKTLLKKRPLGTNPKQADSRKTAVEKITLKDCLLEALRIASKAGHRLIGTQHLLYSILSLAAQEPTMKEFFSSVNRSPRRLRTILEGIVFNDIMMSGHPTWEDQHLSHQHHEDMEHMDHAVHQEKRSSSSVKGLGVFFHDLLEKARQGELDPLVGRAKELERIIQILNRRTKRNPLLVGDPGVGKTAIVYGLAQKINQGDVPHSLKEKPIFSLNLSSLVAGAMFRGDFEARLEAVLKETRQTGAILFIDEIHNIVGAGSAMGTMDAANILKPALAQGEIQVIGSTTLDEYKYYIENDKALERRFQPVFVNEPPLGESIEILRGLKHRYEAFHGIMIHANAIDAAVKLSSRYIKDRFLPDKALDVLDEASAFISIAKGSQSNEKQFELLRRKALALRRQKEEKLHQRLYETAFALKKQEETLLKKALLLEEAAQLEKNPVVLTEQDIKHVMTIMTGIPIQELTTVEYKRLERLEQELSEFVIGQKEAIISLANSIRRSRAGLNSRNRPLGSFIFIGPSGVGKTELARVLARKLFGPDSFIKLDMSEFMEPHSVSRLIGAPAGYVGYGKGGDLTEKVRRNPHSLILFDEIEKAHPQIFNILLQILEDGILSDATGLEADFKNTVIILTSNLGSEKLYEDRANIGFASEKNNPNLDYDRIEYDRIEKEATRSLQNYLRPEFLNRIDDVIVFQPLSLEEITNITALQLKQLASRIKEEKNITVAYGKKVLTWLAKKAFDRKQGARQVRRVIERELSDVLAKQIISDKIKQGQNIKMSLKQDNISFDKA